MRVKLKGLIEDVDRHGNVRLYYRARGRKKVRLREKFGTAEFLVEYQCAQLNVPYLSAKVKKESEKRPRTKSLAAGTFAGLCHMYYTRAAGTISADTMERRKRILEKICERYPDAMWADLTPRIVTEIRDEQAETPGARNNVVKAIGALFSWAKEAHIVETNPANGIRRLHAGKSHHAWTMDEVRRYCEHHLPGTPAHRALVFLLFTGLRVGDVARLGWANVSGSDRLTTEPTKTAKSSAVKIDIPILPPLRAEIDRTPKGQKTFLLSHYGRSMTSKTLGWRVSEWCNEAGLPHCSAHGLRKAGATIAAELGASEGQLMAIYGWTTLQQASHYTRSANRRRMSDSGMALVGDAWTGILNLPPTED